MVRVFIEPDISDSQLAFDAQAVSHLLQRASGVLRMPILASRMCSGAPLARCVQVTVWTRRLS